MGSQLRGALPPRSGSQPHADPAAISCAPKARTVTVAPIEKAIGHKAETQPGVVNVTIACEGSMDGVKIGGSMGLTTWAPFSEAMN
ncbi:MAG TPA: hypothetical protein VMR25_07010 [Planctomycetaceae bacterium]|nr:hypothetical protein [Planctomycetaceae bacterium]